MLTRFLHIPTPPGSAQSGALFSSHRNTPSEHSGVPHGLLGSESTPCSLIPNAHASGSLRSPSVCAPKCSFGTFRCSNGRGKLRSPLAAHRPTFGAPVFRRAYWLRQTLRLQARFAHPPSTHRNAPSEHSGVPHGLLGSESTPCSLIPNAHAPGSLRSPFGAAPNRLFELLRCSQWAGEASLPPAPLSPTTRALRDGQTLRNVCHDGLKKCPSF